MQTLNQVNLEDNVVYPNPVQQAVELRTKSVKEAIVANTHLVGESKEYLLAAVGVVEYLMCLAEGAGNGSDFDTEDLINLYHKHISSKKINKKEMSHQMAYDLTEDLFSHFIKEIESQGEL